MRPTGHPWHVYGGSADGVEVSRHPNGASAPGRSAASSALVPEVAPRLAGSRLATPRQATTPLDRAGLRHARRAPRMPAADFCRAVREDCSAHSPWPGHPADRPGYVSTPSAPSRLSFKVDPQRMADFAVPCQLVPGRPRLIAGSCPSSRAFVPRVLQTPPRGRALALGAGPGHAGCRGPHRPPGGGRRPPLY
jgi:hypothetical protein